MGEELNNLHIHYMFVWISQHYLHMSVSSVEIEIDIREGVIAGLFKVKLCVAFFVAS